MPATPRQSAPSQSSVDERWRAARSGRTYLIHLSAVPAVIRGFDIIVFNAVAISVPHLTRPHLEAPGSAASTGCI